MAFLVTLLSGNIKSTKVREGLGSGEPPGEWGGRASVLDSGAATAARGACWETGFEVLAVPWCRADCPMNNLNVWEVTGNMLCAGHPPMGAVMLAPSGHEFLCHLRPLSRACLCHSGGNKEVGQSRRKRTAQVVLAPRQVTRAHPERR